MKNTVLRLFAQLIAVLATCTGSVGVSAATSEDIVAGMRPLPEATRGALDTLFTFTRTPQCAFSPESVKPLVAFIRQACVTDSGWELPKREGAAGSAYIVKVSTSLPQYLALNFHPGIPDYAVFPAALRYSTCVNSHEMQQAYDCIGAGLTGALPYVSARMTGMEEITPNPESGCYFSYTNSRVFLRCKVDNQDVLFSCAETLAPSTFSNRGVPVGPLPQALFYYSEKPGLNLTGMTWMLSQIIRSQTLSVYIAVNSNETAVATFAWLNAGWKGMNVTRATHILNTQITTLNFSRRIAQHPKVSAPAIAALVADVMAMSPTDVDADYTKYLTYVRTWRDKKNSEFYYSSLLKDLYDPKTTQAMPLSHRRALLVQERIRTLMDSPSWSNMADAATVAFKP